MLNPQMQKVFCHPDLISQLSKRVYKIRESQNFISTLIGKRCNKACVGEIGRKVAHCFLEHHMDIHREPLISLHFNSPDHHGGEDFSITAFKSCFIDQVSHQILENRLIHKLGILSPAGINIQFQLLLMCYSTHQ